MFPLHFIISIVLGINSPNTSTTAIVLKTTPYLEFVFNTKSSNVSNGDFCYPLIDNIITNVFPNVFIQVSVFGLHILSNFTIYTYISVLLGLCFLIWISNNKKTHEFQRKQNFTFICENGGSSEPSMEYALSPLTRIEMENMIHYISGHKHDDSILNKNISDIALSVFEKLCSLRGDDLTQIPDFPDKLGKSSYEPFSMNLDKMIKNLEKFIPLYEDKNGLFDSLIEELVSYHKDHDEFTKICVHQLAMVVSQNVTTIVYHEFVLEQIEHQKRIANTPSEELTQSFLLKQEWNCNVPKGYYPLAFYSSSHSKNQTVVLVKDNILGGRLYSGHSNMIVSAKLQINREFNSEFAYDSVKGDRLTVAIVDRFIIVSAHFSAPSSKLPDKKKSPFPKMQDDILCKIVAFYFNHLSDEFPDHSIIFGADWNIGNVDDSIALSEKLSPYGIFIGNDTQHITGFSLTESRPLGRSSIASLQRLKWGLSVYASKMAFATNVKSLIIYVEDGVEEGTPGIKIKGDHAKVIAQL
jgi:hypothetical protein